MSPTDAAAPALVQQGSLLTTATAKAPSDAAEAMVRPNQTVATRRETIDVIHMPSSPSWTYVNVPWSMIVRKETFVPAEVLDSEKQVNLIFQQIVSDLRNKSLRRMFPRERQEGLAWLERNKIASAEAVVSDDLKRELIAMARKWSIYFCRLFDVKPLGGKSLFAGGQRALLGVNQNGIQFVEEDPMGERKVVASFEFSSLLSFKGERGRLNLETSSATHVLEVRYALAIQQLIDSYIISNERDAKYVMALRDHLVRDQTMLSCKQYDVIKLAQRDQEGREEGWCFGMLGDRTGWLESELTVPILGEPTKQALMHARREVDKRLEALRQQEMAAETAAATVDRVPSAAANDAVGRAADTAAASAERNASVLSADELFIGRRVVQPSRSLAELAGEENAATPVSMARIGRGKLSMLEYAMHHFRRGTDQLEMQRTSSGSIRGTLKFLRRATLGKAGRKEAPRWTWSELAQLVKFQKQPIQASLVALDPSDTMTNKLALEGFMTILRYMGDYPSKGRPDIEMVQMLLRCAMQSETLHDEIYCQLVKQVTNNKSKRPDGCLRGWQLLLIVSGFVKPSSTFEPYLRHYMQDVASDSAREFHHHAALIDRYLSKTIRYGGRKIMPSAAEVEAVNQGRHTKIQKIFFPGDSTKSIKVNAVTVIQDVLKDLCDLMAVTADDEFGIFIYTGPDQSTPLQPSDYLLDTTTILDRRKIPYRIYIRKLLWFSPISLENSLHNLLLYEQCRADFVNSFLLSMTGGSVPEQWLQNDVALLAALQYQASNPEKAIAHLHPYAAARRRSAARRAECR